MCRYEAHLLHELTAGTEKHSTEMLGLAIRKQSFEWRALASEDAGSSDRVENDATLNSGLLTIHFVSSNSSDHIVGILISLMSE